MADNTPQGFEMTLGDGTVVKGANMEEAFKSLADMKVNTANAYKQEKAQREALEQRMATLEAQQQVREQPKPVAAGQFDKNEYYRLLNDSPLDAQNYLDAFRFGLQDPSAVPQYFQRIDRTVTDLNQQAVAGAFLARHAEDFPQDGNAASALTRRVEQLVQRENYPLTTRTMELAYRELVEEGAIKPLEKAEEEKPTVPPPNLSGAGGQQADADLVAKAEQMSDDDLKKFLIQQGVLR